MPKKKKAIEIETVHKLAVFKGKKIRRMIHNDEWWFSVIDVCGALTGSPDPGAYWRKLKQRLKKEGSEVVTFCHDLKLESLDGKKYKSHKSKKQDKLNDRVELIPLNKKHDTNYFRG